MQKRTGAVGDEAIGPGGPTRPAKSPPNTKKRKLRKGTQSCWECKRRKAKCSWVMDAGTKEICDGCKRRGSTCVGQEYEADPANQKRQLSDRVSRLEDMMACISRERPWTQHDGTIKPSTAPAELDTRRPISSIYGRQSREDLSPDRDLAVPRIFEHGDFWNIKSLSKALLAAWPSIEDLQAIIAAPMGVEVFHTINCLHGADASGAALPSVVDLLKTPDSETHPVLIGRSLLHLASFLQCLTPDAITDLRSVLSLPPEEIMDRAFTIVTKLVTNDADLTLSMEGIECILMESLYHNNAGRLRSAWSAIRRAMSAAQLMGLDQKNSTQEMIALNGQQRVDSEHVWLRIIEMDSYLSLQLGLPLGASHTEPMNPDLMARAGSQERLGRAMIHAAGFVCQRNTSGTFDMKSTREVDNVLLQASKDMPASWWLVPDLQGSSSDREASLANAKRFMMQMAYYHTLERLHLPYLVNRTTERASDYNRATALHASREVLQRFVAFRKGTPVGSHFCRGIDFLAFGACTAICLSRMQARLSPGHVTSGSCVCSSSLPHSLDHKGLADRGLMESTKQLLELVAEHCPSDPIAGRIANGLTHLLAIDADVASGKAFRLDSTGKQEGHDLGMASRGTFDKGDFIVAIPHIGDIKFVRESLSRSIQASDLQTVNRNGSQGKGLQEQSLRNASYTVHEAPDDHRRRLSTRSSLTSKDANDQDHTNTGPSITESDVAGVQGLAVIEDPGLHQSYTQFSDFLTGSDMGMQGVETAWFDALFMGYPEDFAGQ